MSRLKSNGAHLEPRLPFEFEMATRLVILIPLLGQEKGLNLLPKRSTAQLTGKAR